MGFKEGLRRRLALRRYPRRSAAIFTDENDHNPRVLQDCSECSGRGQHCEGSIVDGREQYALGVCMVCDGTGITGEVEPCFPDERPEASACVDDHGWITCPNCEWRFALRHKDSWTGRRHLRCGQKIRVVDAETLRHDGRDR